MSFEEYMSQVFKIVDITSWVLDIVFFVALAVTGWLIKRSYACLDKAIISFKIYPCSFLKPAKAYRFCVYADKLAVTRYGFEKWSLPVSKIRAYNISEGNTLTIKTDTEAFRFTFPSRCRDSVSCFAFWVDRIL